MEKITDEQRKLLTEWFCENQYFNENTASVVVLLWAVSNPERFCILVVEAKKEGVIK